MCLWRAANGYMCFVAAPAPATATAAGVAVADHNIRYTSSTAPSRVTMPAPSSVTRSPPQGEDEVANIVDRAHSAAAAFSSVSATMTKIPDAIHRHQEDTFSRKNDRRRLRQLNQMQEALQRRHSSGSSRGALNNGVNYGDGVPVADGDTGAEALLWAALDVIVFYAPWSVAVLVGMQLWLIELWER